jgi:16S rRNA (cytosine1402-N4)-methyltransferase
MIHTPVMLEEVLHHLAPRDGALYLDGTFGGGGYAAAILDSAACTLWAIDRDPAAIARGAALAQLFPGRLHLLQGKFGDLLQLMGQHGISRLDGVVLDFGLSSFQLDDPDRGFGFRGDGPLDMRMGADGPTAADLVARLDEAELAQILFELGEERHARRVARAIVAARAKTPVTTTAQLAAIVRSAVPRDRFGHIDPATRSFQALRIRVNDELAEISRALDAAVEMLGAGGRLVVVSFHSLEDRLVKQFFAGATGRSGGPSRHDPAGLRSPKTPKFRLLTERALRPGPEEVAANPRARSARLRAMLRTETAA